MVYPDENTHGIPIDHGLTPGWLWPHKHNEKHETALRAHGRRWRGQYMQAPNKTESAFSLWNDELIATTHLVKIKTELRNRRLVSIDPATTNTDDSDEHGIIVGSSYGLENYSVEADYTCKGSPKTWAETAIRAYEKHEADGIVIEVNQGGDMCEDTLRNAGYKGRIFRVHATKGKVVRAEPVAALYEMGFVNHRFGLTALEDEMIDFDTLTGKSNGKSPNRVDALVWLLTELSGGDDGLEDLLKLAMGG